MGFDPCSHFGFGVAVKEEASDAPRGRGSPWEMLSSGEPNADGIVVLGAGFCDEPTLLVLIHESVSVSGDWSPKRIDGQKMGASAEWTDKINAYVKRWGLTPAKGFETPGFIHAPYYG